MLILADAEAHERDRPLAALLGLDSGRTWLRGTAPDSAHIAGSSIPWRQGSTIGTYRVWLAGDTHSVGIAPDR